MFKVFFCRWLAAIVLLGATLQAHAQATTYIASSTGNYTGTVNFTACGTPPCQNFTTAMSMSGSFTTSAPLAANLANVDVAPLLTSYSFSDGLTTYSSADPDTRIYQFEISTNGSGAITAYAIVLQRWLTGASPHVAGQRMAFLQFNTRRAFHNWRCVTVGTTPAGATDGCVNLGQDTSSSNAEFFTISWSIAPAAVPAAAASIPTLSQWGLIFLTGLLGIAAFLRMHWSAYRNLPNVPRRFN